jgi:hypothetical protein
MGINIMSKPPKYFWISLCFSIMQIFISGCLQTTMDEEEARKVLNEFYMLNEPEPLNDLPLLKAGKAIVPYLSLEIQKKDIPKRRYAIGALGKIGDKRALPSLLKIFEDRTEIWYFRSDAIEAIWHIDKNVGEEYASKHTGESKEIDRTIQLLRQGKI